MCRFGASILTVLLVGVLATVAEAATTDWIGDPRAAVRLVTDSDSVGGQPVLRAGLEFRYAPGWHGYWRTPGDAGIAPVLDWAGSANVKSTAVAWPAPTRLVVSALQNAVYTGQFILPLTIGLSDPQAAAQLNLSLDYAACAEICVPEHADLSLRLPSGDGHPSVEAAALTDAAAAIPETPAAAGFDILRQTLSPGRGGTTLVLELRSLSGPFRHPDLFVEGAGDGLPAAPIVQLGADGQTATLIAALPARLADDRPLLLTVVDEGRAAEIAGANFAPPPDASLRDLGTILALALLGGFILNLMPCVLPILSIKLLGLARHAGADRRATRLGFAATALGIVASFLVLAAALAVLKLSGATLGWGIQFQQPWFLAALAVITVLFAASLFEWLPIGLPGFATKFGGNPRHGPLAEAFLAGAVSTLLATPCSAPFVGTAVGFALARGPAEIVAVFTCLGLGMALPFLLVALFPRLVGWLPRPGPWMVRLRKILGLLLLGTAVWLLVVLWSVAGGGIAGAVATLLAALLTLRAWTTHRYSHASRSWTRPATAALAALAVAAALIPTAVGPRQSDASEIWQAFDSDVLNRHVAAGDTVLVDVTARWCLTCKVNDLIALDTPQVRARLAEPGTIRMRADWSRPDPKIAAYLQRFGRFGIPLDVVYGPQRRDGDALPELLSPALVVAAIDRARGSVAQAPGPRTAAIPSIEGGRPDNDVLRGNPQ